MTLNPVTLLEESDWERLERQRSTGVMGNGTHVICHPDIADPSIQQVQHRASCLSRPYPACFTGCPHQTFTLVFKEQQQDPFELLSCPRWSTERDRINGAAPDTYVTVEQALCQRKPYSFCNACPSKETLEEMGADKVRPGWYGRWRRFMKDLELEEDRNRG